MIRGMSVIETDDTRLAALLALANNTRCDKYTVTHCGR